MRKNYVRSHTCKAGYLDLQILIAHVILSTKHDLYRWMDGRTNKQTNKQTNKPNMNDRGVYCIIYCTCSDLSLTHSWLLVSTRESFNPSVH